MINVMIADDQQLLVDLLRIGLEQSDGIRVVACAKNGLQATELAVKHQPDVILMDIMMPECDGIQATKIIKEWNSRVKILILTNGEKESNLQKAMQAGADGYVLKDISQEDLILAVKSVFANMKVVSQQTDLQQNTHVFTESSLKTTEKRVMIDSEAIYLTQREVDLIAMIVEGKEVAEMSAVLQLSEGSVRNLTSGVIHKLKVKDRTQLAVFALKNQLVEAF
ncbi:MAG: response regulator transcription factor [Bacillota bacterium]|nr:response regulator transcription factor [Bacillota bacterium]MDW7678426.1 response regulator transcription factor [Bacillota bacterium]